MRGLFVIVGLALASLAGACATSATIQQAPLSQGVSREYEHDFATVREAARATIQSDMPVGLRSVEERDGAYIFNFEIGVSAFSWGEVGRVVVAPVDADTTRLTLYSQKRDQLQVTGHGQRDLSERLFAGVDGRLR